MKLNIRFALVTILLLSLALVSGCNKEKIVTSTEFVEKTEVIELPPDTVTLTDTVYLRDTTNVTTVDTLYVTDTALQQIIIHDTTTLIDTVLRVECAPNEHLAFSALQFHSDPLVLDYINQEFGIADGWALYLSEFMSTVTPLSATSFEITGTIDYWTPDWSQFFPLEYSWIVAHTGGDPTDPTNWVLQDPAPARGTGGGVWLATRPLKNTADPAR